jgi:hypothetical protein
MEMYNIKKLNEVEDREKYYVEVSSRFAALETTNKQKQTL